MLPLNDYFKSPYTLTKFSVLKSGFVKSSYISMKMLSFTIVKLSDILTLKLMQSKDKLEIVQRKADVFP